MNRAVYQSSLVQRMMGGSTTGWWNLNNMKQSPSQQTSPLLPSSSPSPSALPQYPHPSSNLPLVPWHDGQDLPESWSQLLLGGLMEEDGRYSFTPIQSKKVENNWEDQVLYQQGNAHMVDVKQERSEGGCVYGQGNEETVQPAANSSWNQILPVSSPMSCITSFSSNMLDFSNKKAEGRHPRPDNSSECNSTATASACKKARIQGSSSAQSTFKVRKEKLGDRVTALHQLVSPFGKTDTASVLLEAIGYIRFLQRQIEALCSPYLGNTSGSTRNSGFASSQGQGERGCIFPEDPGQLLNDACMKRTEACDQKATDDGAKKDLKSRGLCLVPISCTMHVGSDNGADYWAPALGAAFR